jgi:putative RNA 2'-phosphotransferase
MREATPHALKVLWVTGLIPSKRGKRLSVVWYSKPAAIGTVMSAIRHCPEHGLFDANTGGSNGNDRSEGDDGNDESCPVCGASGEVVLNGGKRVRLSKFLSGALRHFPGDLGLALDERGWASYEALLDIATERYPWADRETVDAVLSTDPKGRFERENGDGAGSEGERVRASYGHSIDVTLDNDGNGETGGSESIPGRLYHGIAPDNRETIAAEGLSSMSRREVHLSGSPGEARTVGARHASDPIVFAIDTEELMTNGHLVTERGRGVYTTDRVPPEYLAEYDGSE